MFDFVASSKFGIICSELVLPLITAVSEASKDGKCIQACCLF